MAKPKAHKKTESHKEISKESCCSDSCCYLRPTKVGLTLGTLFAMLLFFEALFAMLLYPWGHAVVALLGSILLGYSATPLGLVFGLLWGFLKGFFIGYVFAWLYNLYNKYNCC